MNGPEKSVVPIIAVHRIMGLFPVNSDLRLDLALLFTNCLAVLVLVFYSLQEKFKKILDETTIWASFVQFAVVDTVALLCIAYVTFGRSKIRSYLSQCHSIHDRFLALRFHPKYPSQRNTLQIKSALSITALLAVSDTNIYNYTTLSKLFLLIYNFCDAVCFLEIILFAQLVEISNTFLSLINRYMKTKKVGIFDLKERERMGEVLKIFHEVHAICRSLNSTFSVPLLALTAMSFVCMLVDSYHAFSGLSESLRRTDVELHYIGFVSRVVWIFYQVYKLFVLLDACSVMQKEADKFTVELREIIAAADPEQIVEMEDMIRTHHLIYKKVDFTAADFYELDYSLMLSIVGAVGSYLVILIQFGASDESATPVRNVTQPANGTLVTTMMSIKPSPTPVANLPVNATVQ